MTYTTSIDWPDLENNILYVRDKNLDDMIREDDFIGAIFHTWLHKKPTENEKKMLNSILVSFVGGWSFLPPVIFAARIAATTKAPMAQCLAAGFSASGPAHTSAIAEVMDFHLNYKFGDVRKHILKKLERGEKIPGFGHPVVRADPRVQTLLERASELEVCGTAVERFKIMEEVMVEKKGVYGNVDGVNGSILVDLGFDNPEYGPALFLIGRAVGMAAHVIEEMKNKPFAAVQYLMPAYNALDFQYQENKKRVEYALKH
jgi:citrate synthase